MALNKKREEPLKQNVEKKKTKSAYLSFFSVRNVMRMKIREKDD